MTPDQALYQRIVDGLKEEEGLVHAETAVATAAALTGESVLRAARLDLGRVLPGQAVFSDRVNQLLCGDTVEPTQWPEASVWGLVRDALLQVGVAGDLPPVGEIMGNAAAHVYDGGPWPFLTIPKENHPQREPLHLAVLFRGPFHDIARTFRLSPELQVACAALACVHLLAATQSVLTPAIGVRLAFEILVGVAKTGPLVRVDQRIDPESFGRAVVRFEGGSA
jgi:hypothetical protein